MSAQPPGTETPIYVFRRPALNQLLPSFCYDITYLSAPPQAVIAWWASDIVIEHVPITHEVLGSFPGIGVGGGKRIHFRLRTFGTDL